MAQGPSQPVVPNQTAVGRSAARGVSGGQVFYLGMNTATVATSASAGSAPALPATPAGYALAVIGGVQVKIPFYNV